MTSAPRVRAGHDLMAVNKLSRSGLVMPCQQGDRFNRDAMS
jgi:hypothetical protein